jgi:hypothetical protein
MSETDDQADMLDAVRSAMETHSEAESSHQAVEHEQRHEVADHDQAATEMGLQVAALMNQEERQRSEQSKQQRDARGRFAPATSIGEAGFVHETAGALHVPEAPAAAPPSSWSPEAKALYNDLPQPIRHAIAKREFEIGKGFQDYRDRTERHAEIESVIAPHRQTFQRNGMKSDAEAINHVLRFSNPLGAIQFLMSQAGIRPDQLGGPQINQENFNSAVRQQAAALAQDMFARWQIQEFERNAPADYSHVKPLMAAAITNGLAQDLHSAYRVVTEPARRAAGEAAHVNRKMAAANASLNGAPHGVAATPPRSNGRSSNGKFGDIADDVRAAMASLI